MLTCQYALQELGPRITWDLPTEQLVRLAVQRGEGQLTREGALSVMTGKYTGRSPKDKFTVYRDPSAAHIDWNSDFNRPFAPDDAERLTRRIVAHAKERPQLFGLRAFIGRGKHRIPIALVTEYAWHALMGRHMYVRPTAAELAEHHPEFTLLYTPSFCADPVRDRTASEAVIMCDLEANLGLIGGTAYGGEEKKFFFYLMNYRLPLADVFPMHCSANVGERGDVSVIFGLSGTGKTTLSTDPTRRLLGDDEHGWSPEGVFNFEGGCYAKMIRLSQQNEPLIWNAVHSPHAILENVPVRDGVPDFRDATVENTRGVYPMEAIPDADLDGEAGQPTTVVFLTFDASGTLPPISVLNEEQALYWFLAGYTAKVAGTERGLGNKPVPTFSACFGAPFLPLPPKRYVELMRDYLRRYQPLVVLMNTGAVGGPMGEGGQRPNIDDSRRMLAAAQSGVLRDVPCDVHPQFGVRVPREVPGVDPTVLDPRRRYAPGPEAYGRAVAELAATFREKVNQRYAGTVPQEVLDAAPSPE